MVNRSKAESLLASLQHYVSVLRELGDTPQDEFLADRDKVASAKYHFVIAIECCVDLANHLIASEGWRVPSTYADSFAVLVERDLLPSETRPSFLAMARFRDRLVHLYWDVEDQLVYEYLVARLDDFETFGSSIVRWIAESGNP